MKKIAFAIASMALLNVAHAAPYGTAGCGLGSIVFGDKPGIVQIFAATTNGTSASQTFGITSGTSNCVASKSEEKVSLYIESNRDALAKDMARGNGEAIEGLSSIAGCHDAAKVGETLKTQFKSIFPTANTNQSQVNENMINILKSKDLACGNLG
jgi:hypothetical protein